MDKETVKFALQISILGTLLFIAYVLSDIGYGLSYIQGYISVQ